MDIALTLRSYREALGLAQEDAARLMDVAQPTWSRWEQGVREPRDPLSVIMVLQGLVDFRDEIFDAMCDLVEAQSSQRVQLGTYMTDEAFWRNNPRAKAEELPASLHRSAAALCAFLMMEDAGILVEIVDAEGE